MSFKTMLEAVAGIVGDDTISVSGFNVLYDATREKDLNITTVKDKIQAPDNQPEASTSVSVEGGYHLRSFVHDLGKVINEKVNGTVKVNFVLKNLESKAEHQIQIDYAHNREGGGVDKVFISAGNKSKSISVSMNGLKAITMKKKTALHAVEITKDLNVPPDYPEKNFKTLLKIIFVQLKRIVKTNNFESEKDGQ